MKALAILLGISSLGLGTFSAVLYQRSVSAEAQHKEAAAASASQLAESQKREQALSAEVAELNARQQEAQKREESLSAQLAEVSKASATSQQQSDALAGLISRKTALEKLMNDDLRNSATKFTEAQNALMLTPSPSAYSAMRRSLERTISFAEQVKPLLNDLTSYIQSNGEALKPSADVVSNLQLRIGKAHAETTAALTALKICLASMRESTLGVTSREGWQEMDLRVAQGDTIVIAASGSWEYAPFSRRTVGPDGENWTGEYRVVAQAPNGALLGRVHGSEACFYLLRAVAADREGKLEFRINDSVLDDNRGTIDVHVWAFKPLAN